MNYPQSSRNFTGRPPTRGSGGTPSTSPQTIVSFLTQPTFTPSMRTTANGDPDIQLKEQKSANIGQYLLIVGILIAVAVIASKKVDFL